MNHNSPSLPQHASRADRALALSIVLNADRHDQHRRCWAWSRLKALQGQPLDRDWVFAQRTDLRGAA
jgi:hypothetical protein